MQTKTHVYVTGLPRSGSTLLCQLLAQHNEIFCDGMTSPLFSMIEQTRANLANNEAMLARLDTDFASNYCRIKNVYTGMIKNWLDTHHDKKVSVDKNRGWLKNVEFLNEIDDCHRIIVCIRELGQLFGSIESAHKKTLLLNYRDNIATHSTDARANQFFSESGIVGSALKTIKDYNTEHFETQHFKGRVYYVAYEALVNNPVITMKNIYNFIGVEPITLNPLALQVFPKESDSHYGMKWPHDTKSAIVDIKKHEILPSIQEEISKRFDWFYKSFYP